MPNRAYGCNAHIPRLEDIARIRQANMGICRLDFNWYDIEHQKNVFFGDVLIPVINACRSQDVEILACLSYTPTWASGTTNRCDPPANYQDWYDFIRIVMTYCKDNIWYWSFWNEPNAMFNGSMNDYIDKILKPSAAICHSITPVNRVVGPELSLVNDWKWYLGQVLNSCRNEIDIVGVHCYASDGNAVLNKLNREVMKIINAAGCGGKEKWITETGWQGNEYDQMMSYAQLVPRFYNEWEKLFAYQLRDEPHVSFGIYREDGSAKPAVMIFQLN